MDGPASSDASEKKLPEPTEPDAFSAGFASAAAAPAAVASAFSAGFAAAAAAGAAF